MSSDKYITEQNRASYFEWDGEHLLSLYLGGKVPCGFVNARISPKDLKGICKYLLKEINQLEAKND